MKRIDDVNPLREVWDTPRKTPPFSVLSDENYAPAIREAIRMSADEINAIASQDDAPTFANTIERMEASSQILNRAIALLFNLNECCTSEKLQRTVSELLPEITRHENNVWMNGQLFARVDRLWNQRDKMDLSTEQLQVLELYHQRFLRNGVGLGPDDKERFAHNAERLSLLSETFGHNVLDATNAFALNVTDPCDIEGLPDNTLEAARAEAASRQQEGWTFTLQAPSYRPFMAFADNRELRKRMWLAYNSRCNSPGNNDNRDVIREIVNLRLRQARLLSFSNYAACKLKHTMAQSPEAVNSFLDNLLHECLPFAEKDLAMVTDFAQQNGFSHDLQPWDFSYWSERLKKEQYDFDSEALRPYFMLDSVRQGIFGLYNRLYGINFRRNKDIDVYHDDVEVYEVFDEDCFLGVLYLDMFPRGNKRGGAWMTDFRPQSCIGGQEIRPLIQIVCNFTKPVGNTPSLLSFDEVKTFMHEFGHAMHGILSKVHYPSVSGTSVLRDFVEMPSQVMENWCYEPEFLFTFARHYKTGELIPQKYIERISHCRNYLAGWLFLRQLNFGLTDMAYHTMERDLETLPEDLEKHAMRDLLPHQEGTCTSTGFTHIFSGGYAAGYYGYKWAEVLDADIFSRFKGQGIFNSNVASSFRQEILEKGGSEHPSVLFRNFMGRDPDTHALLRRCGFVGE